MVDLLYFGYSWDTTSCPDVLVSAWICTVCIISIVTVLFALQVFGLEMFHCW